MFVGATLLFVVQPMVGKMILPLLGGTPAVWSTCMVFFQAAPLLQKWFSHTGHPAARDPYFLYAASNLGSMLALLGYPILIEPRLHVRGESWMTQTRLWSIGYVALVVLIALCAFVLWRRAAAPAPVASSDAPAGPELGRPAPAESSEPPASFTSIRPPSLLPASMLDKEPPSMRRRLLWIVLAFIPS